MWTNTKLTVFLCSYTQTGADYHSRENLLPCFKSQELPNPKMYMTTSIYLDHPLQTSRPTPNKTSTTATGTYPTRWKTTTSTLLTTSTASPRRLLWCQQHTCRQTALWSISLSWSPRPRYRRSHSRSWWLLHVESLEKSSHEVNSNLLTTIKNNTDKPQSSVLTSKLQLWITSLQIPEEHHNAFLAGYEDSMPKGKQ